MPPTHPLQEPETTIEQDFPLSYVSSLEVQFPFGVKGLCSSGKLADTFNEGNPMVVEQVNEITNKT